MKRLIVSCFRWYWISFLLIKMAYVLLFCKPISPPQVLLFEGQQLVIYQGIYLRTYDRTERKEVSLTWWEYDLAVSGRKQNKSFNKRKLFCCNFHCNYDTRTLLLQLPLSLPLITRICMSSSANLMLVMLDIKLIIVSYFLILRFHKNCNPCSGTIFPDTIIPCPVKKTAACRYKEFCNLKSIHFLILRIFDYTLLSSSLDESDGVFDLFWSETI